MLSIGLLNNSFGLLYDVLFKTFPVLKLFRVPVRTNVATLIFILFLACFMVMMPYYAAILRLLLIYFVAITAHEYGHVLMARRYGYKTDYIRISPIGGAAYIPEADSMTNKQAILVSLAGPMVNVAVAPFFYVIGLKIVAGFNIFLAVFNLIPFFPMDGGRILNASLSSFIKTPLTVARITFWSSMGCFMGLAYFAYNFDNILYLVVGIMLMAYNWSYLKIIKAEKKI
jgi:Zn-dependent protease